MPSLVPRPPSSVCIHNNTWEQKSGNLLIACMIMSTTGRSKRGRPGTKANMCQHDRLAVLASCTSISLPISTATCNANEIMFESLQVRSRVSL